MRSPQFTSSQISNYSDIFRYPERKSKLSRIDKTDQGLGYNFLLFKDRLSKFLFIDSVDSNLFQDVNFVQKKIVMQRTPGTKNRLLSTNKDFKYDFNIISTFRNPSTPFYKSSSFKYGDDIGENKIKVKSVKENTTNYNGRFINLIKQRNQKEVSQRKYSLKSFRNNLLFRKQIKITIPDLISKNQALICKDFHKGIKEPNQQRKGLFFNRSNKLIKNSSYQKFGSSIYQIPYSDNTTHYQNFLSNRRLFQISKKNITLDHLTSSQSRIKMTNE